MSDWKWIDIRWEGDDDFIRFDLQELEEDFGKEAVEALEHIRVTFLKLLDELDYSSKVEPIETETRHCPLINAVCKEDECSFWADDYCVIYLYLGERLGIVIKLREGEETQDYEEILRQLENITAEELANEYLEIYNEKKQQSEYPISYEVHDFFRYDKGIDTYSLPIELREKTNQVAVIVRAILKEQRLAKIREKTSQERAIIPELVEQLMEWAETYEFKSVRLKDVQAFLIEREIELTDTNLRFLQAKTNTLLKAKK